MDLHRLVNERRGDVNCPLPGNCLRRGLTKALCRHRN
jgi:hypothetical protein